MRKNYSFIGQSISLSFHFTDCLVPCMHGGTCVNGTCECPAGFTGEACQEPGKCEHLGGVVAVVVKQGSIKGRGRLVGSVIVCLVLPEKHTMWL